MKLRSILLGAVACITLAACDAASGYIGPQTAPFFEVDTFWFNGRGMPTAVPKGSEAAGYREEAGKISDIYSWIKTADYEATGKPSWMLPMTELSDEAQRIMALFYLCSMVPEAEPCGDPNDAPG